MIFNSIDDEVIEKLVCYGESKILCLQVCIYYGMKSIPDVFFSKKGP